MSYITLPFSWLLNFFYDTFQSYGTAIILFGVLVKLIMLPFQMKSKHSMMRTTILGPHMKELEKKYGNNKQRYQEELSKLYKREKVNPASGCIWTLIPFPILIALYSVVRQPLSKLMSLTTEQITTVTNRLVELGVYVIPDKAGAYEEMKLANLIHENFDAVKSVVSAVKDIDFNFLGLNLSATPQWNFFTQVDWSASASWGPALGLFLIPFISAGLSYLTTQLTQRNNPTANMGGAAGAGMGKTMMLTMPLVSVYICFIMPAAMGLYWIVQSLLSCIEEIILGNHYRRAMDKENADFLERERLREEELERKRQETERLRAEGKNP
jgi:YidC/Oxa1 family membrane protein insertase